MADGCKVSATMVAQSEKKSCVVKVDGHSRAKGLLNKGEYMASPPFSVGGHNWVVRYYPNSDSEKPAGFIVVRLVLDSADATNVKAETIFSIIDKDGLPMRPRTRDHIFPHKGSSIRYTFQEAALEGSTHLLDDCFSIRFDLTVLINNTQSEEKDQFVAVPPSDLHRHFGNLLETMDGADVTFLVGGDKFSAHRLVLAARSHVFKAELLGPMKEKHDSLIEIHEMEAHVFKCLLYFIYTDTLPASDMESLDVMMASHLLVAADRYDIERLKLICEHKLCNHIDAGMVATILVLAEQHSCHGLKKACMQFLASPSNLQTMMTSDGYEHLKRSCPSVLRELIARPSPIPLVAAKDINMAIFVVWLMIVAHKLV
ncbi:BTB/POZ and MATH domain-containing protein 2-like [Triticum dicoccoides]|uniref:BTB/POZ and MATH domain-containing protein 2-like n=1 Tax=Triticum dicoccoides TaxID=85692 RepID=UPI00188ECE3F|nr:BTB/POZ and MATH domain-containing protein 2-like [Triticum dicoccoides]